MTLLDERPIRPMLAKTGEPFDSTDHVFEPKWDGQRLLLFKIGGKIELQNRNLRDATGSYPELQQLSPKIKAKTAIVDGEAVVLSRKGTPDFQQIQNRFGIDDPHRAEALGKTIPVTYVAFDLLHLDGRDIIGSPLEERKKKLLGIVNEDPFLIYGEHVETSGRRFYREALKKGFEGIIAKERGSSYLLGTRGGSWVKIKGAKTIDCIIVGFTKGEGTRAPTFGSLVVAAYNQRGELQHLGNVGGGLDEQTLETLSRRLTRLARKTPVLNGRIDAPAPVTWVRPEIVCEARYMSVTTDGKLRFPRFSRLRPDKPPKECQIDY